MRIPARHHILQLATALLFAASTLGQAAAQSLPPPSRTIFKCEQGGKVAYSDEPCIGAKELDIVVPRGMDKLSGTRRTGADVGEEIGREQLAQALKPLTGMTPAQFAAASKRSSLPAAAAGRCRQLDAALPAAVRREREATAQTREQAQIDLYVLRKQFKSIGC